MASEEEARADDAAPTPFVPDEVPQPARRRSTYTPPPARKPTPPPAPAEAEPPVGASEVVDDDALAAALEEQLRPFTGTIPVVAAPDDSPEPRTTTIQFGTPSAAAFSSIFRSSYTPPAPSKRHAPAPDEPVVPSPDSEASLSDSASAPSTVEAAPPSPWEEAPRLDPEPPMLPDEGFGTLDVRAPEHIDGSGTGEDPAGSAPITPATDSRVLPTSASPPPSDEDQEPLVAVRALLAGEPRVPIRRSLPDDVLAREISSAAAEPGRSLEAMNEFERQLQLRRDEAQEYRVWEESMRSIGTPEALAVVADVLPDFESVLASVAPPVTAPEPDADIDSFADPPDLREPDEKTDDVAPLASRDPQASLVVPASMPYSAPLPEKVPDSKSVDGPPASVPDAIVEQPGASAHAAPLDSVPATAGDTVQAPAVRGVSMSVEDEALTPTPADRRVGRAVRLFWLWFAPNSSLLTIGLGGVLLSLGMSLRQSIIATLTGVVLSFIPLGLGTLAGRRSGQPTLIVSRATFGIYGNIVPAVVAFVSRLFWGGTMLWLLGAAVAAILAGSGGSGGLGSTQLTVVTMVVAFIIALLVAFFGYTIMERLQFVVAIVSAVMVVGLVVLTHDRIHLSTALSTPDGQASLVVTGAVLVFSVVGVVWANSAADLARYQRPGGSGAAPMLSASFGAAVPAFVLVAYGSLLAASSPTVASGLIANPVDTLGRMLPSWYPAPLIVGTALSLLSGVVVSIYSGSFALRAAGARLRQPVSTLLVAVLVLAAGCAITALSGDLFTSLRDLATTLAVPVAAWAGMFCTEVMLRNRPYHAASLLTRGGVYPTVRWPVLVAYVVICAIGFGFTNGTLTGTGWEGYGFALIGIPTDSGIGASDIGVFVALLLGLVAPLGVSLSAIRAQESAITDGADAPQ